MGRELIHLHHSDIRKGADKLHSLLDGRLCLSDKVWVVVVGLTGALLPTGLLMLLHRGLLWF